MYVTESGSKLVRAFSKIPGPICLPVIGNLYLYKLGILNVTKYHKVLQNLFETYGPIVKEKIGPSTVIHIFDPEDAKHIYQNEGKIPYVVPLQETAQLYRRKSEMSLGLGNINGEEWYRLRAAVRHLMLKPKDVQQFLPAVHQVTQDFVKRLYHRRNENDIVPNIVVECSKWIQESAGVVCFDKRLGYLDGGHQEKLAEEVIQANRIVFHLSALLKFSLPIYKYIATPKWKRLVEAEDIVVRTTIRYIEEALSSIETLAQEGQLTNSRYGFLVSLLAKQELSKKDITTLTLSLFTDGLSTTVPSVLFNLYALATNPQVQEKAFEEVTSVVGSSDVITSAHLSQLNYIKAIVKETFRMYPNGTEISRIISDDLILSGFDVPAKTSIAINMGVHFRSEKYFSTPEQFRPERWLRGDVTDNVHPYVLTPFGFGTRTCAGRRFAEQDMYVGLTEIIRNFQLSYEGPQTMQQEYRTLLMPVEPLLIRFVPRQR